MKSADPFPIPKLQPWRCEFEFVVPNPEAARDMIEHARTQIAKQAAQQETRAVIEWSDVCGLTPERWLELFGVETTIEHEDDGKVRLVTRPVARELP